MKPKSVTSLPSSAVPVAENSAAAPRPSLAHTAITSVIDAPSPSAKPKRKRTRRRKPKAENSTLTTSPTPLPALPDTQVLTAEHTIKLR